MLYTGTIYPRGYHNPEPLYAALAKRKAKGMRSVRVLFYGHCSKLPFLRDLARTYGVEDAIVIPDEFLSRSDCIALQGEVDLLLHLSWTNPGMDGVLSAKVFEYMASGVPLLSIGAESDTAIGRLLEESGTGVCVGTDEQKVFEVLEIMADQNEYPAWFKPNPVQIDTYSRECQAARLLTLIKDANANLTYESLAMEGEVQSN